MKRRIRPLIAGNWKMNGLGASVGEIAAIAAGLDADLAARLDALVCLPATLIRLAAGAVSGTPLAIGGQDCHARASGAHTGDVSAPMLRDAGASHVIVGHSERRIDHGESGRTVRSKAAAVHAAGMTAVVCVGESAAERDAGATLEILEEQLAQCVPPGATAVNTVVAYEPVWAIGSGLTPAPGDIETAHACLRTALTARFRDEGAAMRLIYGGSVKPANAGDLVAARNVDGALVGGASLRANDFLAVCEACRSGPAA